MFGFFKSKLIQFGDSTFAIRKRLYLLDNTPLYLNKNGEWHFAEVIKFDSAEEALEAFSKVQEKQIAVLDDEWEL